MALSKNTSGHTHSAQFIKGLSRSERNALRVILLHSNGPHDLRRALGIEKQRMVSHADHATGCARRGETIRLFDLAQHSPAHLAVRQ